ncbi:MAG: NAD(+) synthase [Solirubrobacterales bacterium]
MDAAATVDKLTAWIREQVSAAGCDGAVLGLSGGIDSAVVAGLAVRACPGKVLGIVMPCHSLARDTEHGRLTAETFKIESKTVDLSPAFDQMLTLFGPAAGPAADLAKANVKPRLRMITLYYHAQQRNALVLGTGNRSELTIGYFTKHGDGAVDLLPIASLVKQQVREVAKVLGVPSAIIEKPPSAGLWEGQTDESEMGISYAELDRYILTGEAPDAVAEKIERMKRASEHKRKLAPIAEV